VREVELSKVRGRKARREEGTGKKGMRKGG
jgi:hypothetical protein